MYQPTPVLVIAYEPRSPLQMKPLEADEIAVVDLSKVDHLSVTIIRKKKTKVIDVRFFLFNGDKLLFSTEFNLGINPDTQKWDSGFNMLQVSFGLSSWVVTPSSSGYFEVQTYLEEAIAFSKGNGLLSDDWKLVKAI